MNMRIPVWLVWIWFGVAAGVASAAGFGGISFPTNGTVYLQPTNQPLSLVINVIVTNEFNARINLFDGTNLLGSTSLQQHDILTWSNIAFGEHFLTAVQQASAGPVTSSVVRVTVAEGGWAIVPAGSNWSYLDGGDDPGSGWPANTDVSAWKQGLAKLGFGDDDVATWVSFMKPDGTAWPTYYFQRNFTVPAGTTFSNLAVRLRRDDGAIVYLNGEELFRDNMPQGPVQSGTFALGQIPDETEFMQRWITPSRLRPGLNTLSVEIHNSSPQSMDIGFDLSLVVNIPVPGPALAVQRQGTNVVVQWPLGYEGYQLESAPALGLGNTQWAAPVTAPTKSVGGYAYTNGVAGPQGFFRLILK